MKRSVRDIFRWRFLLAKLLHPLPVFTIVTVLSALVYAVPNLHQAYRPGIPSLLGKTALLINVILPVATGFMAALGVHFGFSDFRRKVAELKTGGHATDLHPSDDRTRAIARHLPTAVITFDVNQEVAYLNPAASDLFHIYKAEDHEAIYRFIDSSGLRSSLEEVLRGGTFTVEKSASLPFSPGTDGFWNIKGIPITRHEQVVEALFLIEDRTQYRILEDELVRSEDRYRNIFNHAPCGIFFVDNNGNYLDANPAALEMLGYSLEELTSLSTRELSADSDRRLRRLRETPGWIEEETRYLRKDGEIVEVQLQASSYQSGNETFFIGIAKDVTAKNKLERSLSAARARLKAVLSLESRPLVLLDSKDHIANLNSAAADLLNCSLETLMGIPLKNLVDGDLPPVQETSSASSSACVLNIPDGTPVNLSVIRLSLGDSENSGSLLILSGGPVPVVKSGS